MRQLAASLTVSLAAVVGLGGCATAQRPDPLEPMNRKIFAFNDTVDRAVLKPVATVYRDTVPQPVRTGVTNFVGNFKDVWSAVNQFLQGKPGDGFSDLMRVGTNTVFGVFGLFDVASGLGMPAHREDLGQTLGRWGVGQGAYLVLPFFGPSTLRDVTDLPFDLYTSPTGLIEDIPARNMFRVVTTVNGRANLLQASSLMDDIALDKYVFLRDAYLQRRQNLVYDGHPPDVPGDDEVDDDGASSDTPAAPVPAASAASAP